MLRAPTRRSFRPHKRMTIDCARALTCRELTTLHGHFRAPTANLTVVPCRRPLCFVSLLYLCYIFITEVKCFTKLIGYVFLRQFEPYFVKNRTCSAS